MSTDHVNPEDRPGFKSLQSDDAAFEPADSSEREPKSGPDELERVDPEATGSEQSPRSSGPTILLTSTRSRRNQEDKARAQDVPAKASLTTSSQVPSPRGNGAPHQPERHQGNVDGPPAEGSGSAKEDDVSVLDEALRRHNIPKWTVIVLLCLTAVIVMSISLYWLSNFSRARADAWITQSSSIEPLSIPESESKQEANRLQAQLIDARDASTFHLKLIKDFMRYQFVLTTLATFSAAIAALLLFPVSWNGLQKANSYLVTMFLVSTAVAIGSTTLTQVYRLQENVDENKRLFLAYRVLEDEIRSYYPARQSCGGTPGDNLKQLCETPPAAFIRAIDKRIGDIRSLAVAFDPSRTPTVQDVFKQVSAATQEGGG